MTPTEQITYPGLYPAEMYKEGIYRCVWSNEETREFLKKGWSFELEEGKERKDYVTHTAVKPGETAKRGPGRPPKADPAA